MSGGHYGNNTVQSVDGPVSPNSAAAAVAAVAQGIRQQMMAAAGHNISQSGVDAFALLASSHLPSPADMSPNSSPPDSPLVSNNNVEVRIHNLIMYFIVSNARHFHSSDVFTGDNIVNISPLVICFIFTNIYTFDEKNIF